MSNKIKDFLKGKLTKKEISLVPSSFDMVGDILIFSDFPEELSKKEKIIGEVILRNFKHIKSVFKKTKKYSGTYRVPKLKLIAGEGKKDTEHKENNVRIRLNVEKVYFSPRLSEERKRIFSQVKNGESVLVMFSGSGVYPTTIAKNSNAKEVYGVEINPIAHKYALENLKLNKLESKIKLFFGDVKKILPKISKKFDRIIMPLPKDAEDFLNLAFSKIKRGGIMHFYHFAKEGTYDGVIKIIQEKCKKAGKKCKIIDIAKCGQFSPRVNRVCADFIVK